MPRWSLTPIERFLAKVQWSERWFNGSRCLEWTAGANSNSGHGRFFDKRMVPAHRWAYERWVGPIPEGLVIDHLCQNQRCVNPAHLEAITQGENVLRAPSGSGHNARKTHCKNNHEFTPENTYLPPRGAKGRKPPRICRACRRERMQEYRADHPEYRRWMAQYEKQRPPRKRNRRGRYASANASSTAAAPVSRMPRA